MAAVVLVFAIIMLFSSVANSVILPMAKQNGCDAIRSAILNSSMQCCAIEGAYPPSLSYLERNYGLVVNHKDYVVTYECFAENIAPTVTVTLR